MRFLILLVCLLPASAQVEMKPSEGRVAVIINGKPFTELWYGPETRKPYLHPLRSAEGKIVSRHYPMEQVEGEPKDHPHHRGLWFNHGGVNGVDFWMSDPLARGDNGARIGIVESKPMIHKGGKDKGEITAQFEWRSKDGNALLREDRTMIFYAEQDKRTIDFDITLTALQDAKFLDTKEGSFGLRLAPQLQEDKGTGKMINAEGAEGEKNVWGKRSAWVDYSGTLDGSQVGIAIFDHPSNPRHPTYWHARAYGLFAANIFGLHDFLRDKTQDGTLSLKAGEKLRFRYRVLIHPGDTQSAHIADEYKKYSGKSASSSAAKVGDFALLAGHWQGKIGNAEIEEVWSAPSSGGMMGMFRLVQNGKLGLTEFMTVDETPDGAVMYMRHFNSGLKPREEQPLVWQVVDKGTNKLMLRSGETELKFTLDTPDSLTAVLTKGGKDTKFQYRRVAAPNPTSDR